MKILLEQDFDLDAALSGGKTTTVVEPVLPNDPPPVNPEYTPPPVGNKDKVNKSDALIAMERDLANPEKIKLISKLKYNAIEYRLKLPKQMNHTDIEEYDIMDSMIYHLRARDTMLGTAMVCYCDLIYRFSNPSRYSSLHKLIKKYPKEYKYFLTSNGKNGLSFDRLNTNLTFFTPFQNDSNNWAEYLDWEDWETDPNIGKRFNKLARSFDEFNPPISIKIRNRFTDLYINNLVLACYNVKAFGTPVEWLRKK